MLHFKRFGYRYVVVGPVAEIAAAVKRGHADVTMKDGSVKRVHVDASKGNRGRYVTKAGADSWTFDGAPTGAFVPVDDRPAKGSQAPATPAPASKGKGTQAPATQAPTDPAALLASLDPAVVAALLASLQAPATPAPAATPATPAPAATHASDASECEACGAVPTVGTHPVATHADGSVIHVCRTCKGRSGAAVSKRARERAAMVGA